MRRLRRAAWPTKIQKFKKRSVRPAHAAHGLALDPHRYSSCTPQPQHSPQEEQGGRGSLPLFFCICIFLYCNASCGLGRTMLEQSNSCPAFIERDEDPFTTTFEMATSPTMSRLSMRFSSSFFADDGEDVPSLNFLSNVETPPTPPYRRNSLTSPRRTPPSPTVLRDILSPLIIAMYAAFSNHFFLLWIFFCGGVW